MSTARRLLSFAAIALAGCATPVGVEPAGIHDVARELSANAVSSDRPSVQSRALLTRLSLGKAYRKDPEGTLATLHAGLAPEGELDRLFALAELSFLHAEREGRRDHALAASVYAYAFLVAYRPSQHVFDPRVQLARSVYNHGLALGLSDERGETVQVASDRHALPFGTLDVELDPQGTTWAGWRLERFVAADRFRVRGFRNRYRQPGIGAPLTASLGQPSEGPRPPGAEYIPPGLEVAVTAFLRLPDAREDLATGHVRGRLEIYNEDERARLVVGSKEVPLEVDRTASLACALEGAPIWDYGFVGFRLGDFLPGGETARLTMLRPYRRDHIPVVLVHGTFSSPATWAELINELQNDPEIALRFQLWLFFYNTGNPIGYSAGLLVETLKRVVAELDPQRADPLLHHMVVVGHSQGGLLTKLTAVSSGDRFWRDISREPLSALDLEPDSRAVLERSLFYEPLPFVGRVVFLSTPHGGSYLSDFRVTSWISRLVRMPATLGKLAVDLAVHGGDELYLRRLDRLPTSLDNMRSDSSFLRTLRELPIAPAIAAHSIIAVRGGPPPDGGSDGVVRYESAHIEGVESELVVDSDHSVQKTQQGIQELRRILLEHAAEVSP